MALTKLTKHIVHGATIVQVRFKDLSDTSYSSTSRQVWGSITLTPQYADSILECYFSGMIGTITGTDTSNVDLFLNINGTDEYTVENSSEGGDYSHNFNSQGRESGQSVIMYHRHLPGTTNLQTIEIETQSNNTNHGNVQCRDGFITVKEIASGITTGTPGNTYVN